MFIEFSLKKRFFVGNLRATLQQGSLMPF